MNEVKTSGTCKNEQSHRERGKRELPVAKACVSLAGASLSPGVCHCSPKTELY